jgi:LacI family transcriptional regulator
MDRVKLIDVAHAAGVHPGTASRALNSDPGGRVSAETTRRVVETARRLGYVPNSFARGLRTARSFVIGMIVPDITNPLFPPMVRGAEQVLSQAGYTLVLTDTDNDSVTERRQIEQLRARGTDGFLIATAHWDDPMVDELAHADVPAVLLNRNTASRRLPYVGCDERFGVALAVDHLVHSLRVHGLPVGRDQVLVCPAYSEQAGVDAATQLVASGQDFTAIVAGNDLIALGAIEALADAGLHCPEQVSVTGINDLPLVDKLSPPLTTVALPLREMGALAARMLLAEIEDSGHHGPVAQSLLGVELAVRGSTGPAHPREVEI